MRTGLAAGLLLVLAGTVQARTIYVDSRTGNNAYDGTSAKPINAWVGPVRTLGRAMQLICPGDELVLVDNGTPYYGSLSLVGSRFSGTPEHPFRLQGGGAVISGARPLRPDSWVKIGQDLWRTTPIRKGWYQLIREGEALPKVDLSAPPESTAQPQSGTWGVWRGAIYYRSEPNGTPADHEFQLAGKETGLTLLGVQHVVISDVTFEHFRIDGINAHDRCENVTLVNVICRENGRTGIAVGGTSRLAILESRIERNVQDSILITEQGEVSLTGTEYDRPPKVAE